MPQPGNTARRNGAEPRASARKPGRLFTIALGAVMAVAAVGLFILEKRRPLRTQLDQEPDRTLRNLAVGALSMAVIGLMQSPVVKPLAQCVSGRRLGIAQRLPGPEWLRDAAAFLLLDYTIYLWHILTHKVPFLWRFHLVHHVDLDLDTTTALRFHAADMMLSIPWRATQVRFCGASLRALQLWQTFFFVSVLFHHSNLRLPLAVERVLVRIVPTPRLHGIHHSIVRGETDSNWSSGLSFWDWLHGTLRVDVPQDAVTIGMPGYREPLTFAELLELPFVHQREAWRTTDGNLVERDPRVLENVVFPA